MILSLHFVDSYVKNSALNSAVYVIGILLKQGKSDVQAHIIEKLFELYFFQVVIC